MQFPRDTGPDPAVLEAHGLRVGALGAAPALKINLTVRPGELHLVFSPELGSSTAMVDALLGLSDAGDGQACFRHQDWARLPPRAAFRLRAGIGRVLSRGNWMDSRPVMENLLLPLRHHTVLPDDVLRDMASTLAQRFGLPGLPTLLPHQCTDSDLERAACIKAFLGRPELVVLEHPMEFADSGILPPLVDAIQQVRRRRGAAIWFTRRMDVLEQPGVPADRRYRVAGTGLLEVEAKG